VISIGHIPSEEFRPLPPFGLGRGGSTGSRPPSQTLARIKDGAFPYCSRGRGTRVVSHEAYGVRIEIGEDLPDT